MTFMEEVIKRLLQVKKIDEPRQVFGMKYKVLQELMISRGIETRINTIKVSSQLLNVTPSFIMRMYQLGRIKDERIGKRVKNSNRNILR